MTEAKIIKEVNSILENSSDYLTGHDSRENAYVIEDYPYGRLRTQMYVWVETHPKKGDRVMRMTINPKTGRENKPKASTYNPIMILWKDPSNDHIKSDSINEFTPKEKVEAFVERIGGETRLNKDQLKKYNSIVGKIVDEEPVAKFIVNKNYNRIRLKYNVPSQQGVKVSTIISDFDDALGNKTKRKKIEMALADNWSIEFYDSKHLMGMQKIRSFVKDNQKHFKNKIDLSQYEN